MAISPSQVTLTEVGARTKLYAYLNGDTATGSKLTWTSADPNIVTVDTEGQLVAVAPGATTITAAARCCRTSASALVTVNAVEVASVTISPTAGSIKLGGQMQFTAIARDANGNALTGYTFAWSTSNAAVATIESTGLASGVSVGSATISVSAGGKTATATLTVTAAEPVLASVTISPTTGSIQVGGHLQFTATARDASGNALSGYTFAWSSSNAGVATINASGLASGVGAGSATISVSTGGKIATAALSVTTAPPAIASITVSPTSGTIQVDGRMQFTATAKDASGNTLSGYTFAWSTSSPGVATVDASGLTLGQSAGSATISASAGGKIASAAVTVTVKTTTSSVSQVVLTPSPLSFTALGSVTPLSATVYDQNGQALTGVALGWQTSNSQVASVDSLGRVTSRGIGTALIIATALCCNKADTVVATVTQTVAKVAVSPHTASVKVGNTVALSASVLDANSYTIPGATISWSTSNTQVASVSGGVVTGVTAGTAVIRAVSGTYKDSSIVTVTASTTTTPVLTSVTVSPHSASLLVGDTLRFSAVGRDQNGNVMTGITFTWASSNTNVMTVNQGLVRALVAGVVVLRVSSGSLSDSAVVTVNTSSSTGTFSAPDIAYTNFDAGNSSPFTTAASTSTTGNADIVIMNDPTGQFSGKVAEIHFARTSTTQSADVNRSLKYVYNSGIAYGQTIYARGQVLIPTPAANMLDAQRKLFYFQRSQNSGDAFIFLKAEGTPSAGKQSLKVELPMCPSNNQLLAAGQISFDTKTSIEMQLTINSAPGVSDGTVRVWVDGVLTLDRRDICPMRAGTAPYTTFLFGQQTQHILADLSVLFDEYRYWDNLALSTKRIGP